MNLKALLQKKLVSPPNLQTVNGLVTFVISTNGDACAEPTRTHSWPLTEVNCQSNTTQRQNQLLAKAASQSQSLEASAPQSRGPHHA